MLQPDCSRAAGAVADVQTKVDTARLKDAKPFRMIVAAPIQGAAWTFDSKPGDWRAISAATPASMAASHFLGIEAIP